MFADDYRPDIPQLLPDYEDTWKTARVTAGEAQATPHGQATVIGNTVSCLLSIG